MILYAAIPGFDWTGPEFLGFYSAGFVVTLVWSIVRRSRVNEKFTLPAAAEPSLTDPYEIAFLAGGAPRCSQVVLVRLITTGVIQWRKAKVFRDSKLVAVGPAATGFNDIERSVYSAILGYGEKGMSLTTIPQRVATRLSGIESKLAKLGLRPTAAEARSRGHLIPLPMYLLLAIGIVKMVIGVSRDKPVGFLIVFMIITLIAAIIVRSAATKLTPMGERLLKQMRVESGPGDAGSPDAALCGVALLGISAMANDASLAGLDTALKKQLSQIGLANSADCGVDASSGGSSGCSSGCGGGCGGCGGD